MLIVIKPKKQCKLTFFKCRSCDQAFLNKEKLAHHTLEIHTQHGGNIPNNHPMELRNHAINGQVREFVRTPRQNEGYDLLKFFTNSCENVTQTLIQEINRRGHAIKWYLSVQVKMIKTSVDGIVDRAEPYFRSQTYTLLYTDEISEHDINEAFQKMYASFEQYISLGSNWTLESVSRLKLHVVPYLPLGGGSYIKLPTTLAKSHCIINIFSFDLKCFLWSILSSLYPVELNSENVEHYIPYENKLNMTGITYPVQLNQIDTFENQNDISVNVFGFEESIFSLRISKKRNVFHVNLLLLKDGEKQHCCLIKDFNRFLSRVKRNRNVTFFCPHCLHGFIRQDLLDEHIIHCMHFGLQHTELPREGSPKSILKFDQYNKMQRVPFCIYADFECFSEPVITCSGDPSTSNSTPTTQFTPCSFGYIRSCHDERYKQPPVIYQGENVVETFTGVDTEICKRGGCRF